MNDESASELERRRQPTRSRLIVGIFLLLLGGVMLAENVGYGLPEGWTRYFPVLLIALGFWGVILPSRHLDRAGGIWMVASGMYCLIGLFNLWHLGWTTAWPIFLIAAGLSFMVARHPDRGERLPGNGGS